MNQQLATRNNGSPDSLTETGYGPAEIDLIKRTVAKGATDDELKMFSHIANSYGLDPFKKEIYFWKQQGQTIIFTGRDGFLKIAKDDLNYRGIQSFAVCENDTFEWDGGKIVHKFGGKNRGAIIGAWAVTYHAVNEPCYAYAPWDEYNCPSKPTWQKYKSAMIIKCAETMALKRQAGITGLASADELGIDDPDALPEPPALVENTKQSRAEKKATKQLEETQPAQPAAPTVAVTEPVEVVKPDAVIQPQAQESASNDVQEQTAPTMDAINALSCKLNDDKIHIGKLIMFAKNLFNRQMTLAKLQELDRVEFDQLEMAVRESLQNVS